MGCIKGQRHPKRTKAQLKKVLTKRIERQIIIPPDSELPEPSPTTNKNIPVETILALHKKKLSCSQIAAIVGCSPQNIQQRLASDGISILRAHKDNRADLQALTGAKILRTIDENTIKKASLLQRLSSYGILYDKERLERDLSTQNIKPLVIFDTGEEEEDASVIDMTVEDGTLIEHDPSKAMEDE